MDMSKYLMLLSFLLRIFSIVTYVSFKLETRKRENILDTKYLRGLVLSKHAKNLYVEQSCSNLSEFRDDF